MRLTRIPSSCVAAFLAALVYFPTLGNQLVWDDVLHIAANPGTGDPSSALGYFTRLEGVYYRPIVFLSFFLERAIWGAVPAGFHLTNLLLHATNSGLLVLTAARTGLSPFAALIAGGVFALHPLQSDAVAYVSGRTDLLMTTGVLLAWWALFGFRPPLQRGLAAAASLSISMLSKESGFAGAALVVWYALRHETGWRDRLRLAVPTLTAAILLLAARPGPLRPPTSSATEPILGTAVGAGRALASYLGLFAWPVSLQIDRLTAASGSPLGNAAAAALLIIVIGAGVWGLARRGSGADWIAWVLLFYLPAANVVLLYPSIGHRWLFTPEHNFYAPMAGIAALLALGLERLLRSPPFLRQRFAAAILFLIALAWAVRTVARTFDWADEARLFRRAVEAGAMSPRVWYNYGNTLMRGGAANEAIAAYEKALELAPHDADTWINLGVALQRQGRMAQAISAYERAVSLAPPSALLLENLGTAQLAAGDTDQARRSFLRALELDPRRNTARKALEAIGTPP